MNKTRGKDFTTFEPTHLPNQTTFAERIGRERGKMSLDPTHLPYPNYTGLGRVKGKMSLEQTHDNFELDLLEHNNPTLDEESDNIPTLDEESDNNPTLDEKSTNPTLDEESTNPTLDEESTFFLTRIKKSIRKYIGFCRMPKCLMMFIGSLALIARVISLGLKKNDRYSHFDCNSSLSRSYEIWW